MYEGRCPLCCDITYRPGKCPRCTEFDRELAKLRRANDAAMEPIRRLRAAGLFSKEKPDETR